MRPNRDAFRSTSQQESAPSSGGSGWTKQELLDSSGLSAKTFDRIRKAARVRGPSHGGLSWLFSPQDVVAMIHRCEAGNFTERGPAAATAWKLLLNPQANE
jgi:hypothetical protein